MLLIDGSYGEGGGQILRSSLALAMVTGRALRIEKIRAGRSKPGLMRQHLTAVTAATQIAQADVSGANIGSMAVEFRPGHVTPGEYTFSVGTAGSTTLVLQTVLPALLTASAPSRLTFDGGTHNPFAPPFDFLAKSFLPLVNRMGPTVTAELQRPGFYPAGGGRFTVTIEPAAKLNGFELTQRGEIVARCARALVAGLAEHVTEREINLLKHKTGWDDACFTVERIKNSQGPGNVVMLEIQAEHAAEVFTGFGEVNRSAEAVATHALQQYQRWLKADVPVGVYLADQIMLPLAIAGRGQYITLPLSQHSTTHIELIKRFLEIEVAARQVDHDHCVVEVG
jgi:RNA 3'-terminal phosphate cyclase (ATP)